MKPQDDFERVAGSVKSVVEMAISWAMTWDRGAKPTALRTSCSRAVEALVQVIPEISDEGLTMLLAKFCQTGYQATHAEGFDEQQSDALVEAYQALNEALWQREEAQGLADIGPEDRLLFSVNEVNNLKQALANMEAEG